MKEIERKFILKKIAFSLFAIEKIYSIEQYYTSINPEIRLRKITDYENKSTKYYLTQKDEENLAREEITKEVPESFYLNQKKNKIGNEIHKLRYVVKLEDGTIAKIDLFTNYNLNIAEVEFNSEEEANNFRPPKWFGKEITYNLKYKNKYITLEGVDAL